MTRPARPRFQSPDQARTDPPFEEPSSAVWNREYHRWHSPSLGRDMDLLAFGRAGARVLAFPTSMGRFHQWEDFGMVEALGEHLSRGWIQLFCVDSVDEESWYDKSAGPGARARRHLQYEGYILSEVLPFTRERNGEPFLIVAGASFGAYHAVNIALRHPGLFGRAIGMSGMYDIREVAGEYDDDLVYRNDPSHFMIHESDPGRLEAMRRLDLIMATGREDPHRPNNEHLSGVLWSKDVWHALRIWDGWAHDWPWWQEMIRRYIGGHD